MKLPPTIPLTRDTVGIMLIECLVYIAVFTVIVGLGMMTFYLYWDNSKALRYTTDDITAALRTGERWRADVRSATGEITVETTVAGELLRIPHGTNEVLYQFNAGEIHRQSAPSGFAEPMLTVVKASQMVRDKRGPVNAWRWELELKPRRNETRLPLQFTFEAARTAP
jgi:hypothetical protein